MAKIVEGAALIVGAALAFVFTPELTPFLIGLYTSLATTGASVLLAGIAQALQHNLGTTVALRQAAAPQTIVYGRSRVGGVIVYTSLTRGSNKLLHLVIVHASHAVQAISALYLDGKQVIIGSNGTADSNDHYDASGNKYNWQGKVYWETRLGTPDQGPLSFLTQEDPNWPLTATLAGHACSYIRLTYDAQVFPSGIPGIRVDVVGKNDIYDPRTETRGYTENWALCMADVLCDTNYGLQCTYATEIDEAQLIAAANVCDESVALANGGSEPRYTVNGTFTTDAAPGDILSNLITAAAGRITYVAGVWKIYPAYWQGPSLSLSDADLLGPIKWVPKRKYRDLYNAVKGTFVCPTYPYVSAGPGLALNQKIDGIFDGQWKQTDMPPYAQDTQHGYASDANYASDGATRLWLDTRFPFTISVAAAQRLAKILLLRNRQQGTGTIACRLSAYQAKALDVIQFSHPHWSWAGKLLEVSNCRFNLQQEEGKPPALSIELDLQETDPSVYAWSASEELSIEDNPAPQLPNMGEVDTVGNLVLHSGPDTVLSTADGIQRSRLLVTWNSPDDGFVVHGGSIQLQYQPAGASIWNSVMTMPGDATSAYIDGVSDGQAYNVRVRCLNVSGAYSDWVEAGPYTISNTNSTYSAGTIRVNGQAVAS